MSLPLMKVFGIVLISLGAGVVSAVAGAPSPTPRAPGCAAFPAHDSAQFKWMIEWVVTNDSASVRTFADLPSYPADSILWGGSAAQCDTVAARYQRLKAAALYDTFPVLPVAMLRVGPNRWVADPHFGDEHGMREWVTLDSTLAILKVWRTSP